MNSPKQFDPDQQATPRSDCDQTTQQTLVTDKLANYPAARRRVMPGVEHRRSKYLNNRVENFHNPRGSANGR